MAMLASALLLFAALALEVPQPAASEASSDARAPWLAAPRVPPFTDEARFASALVKTRERPPKMLFIGDSITENWLTLGRAIWDADFAPRGAADLGFGGDRTENTLWRIERGELDGLAPETTVLEIGTNDLDRWNVPEVARGVEAVVAAIRERLPHTRIVVLGILPRDGTPIAPLRVKERAVNLILVSRPLGPRATFSDIGDTLLTPNGTLVPGSMQDGHLHPSLGGYARLATAIDRILARQ